MASRDRQLIVWLASKKTGQQASIGKQAKCDLSIFPRALRRSRHAASDNHPIFSLSGQGPPIGQGKRVIGSKAIRGHSYFVPGAVHWALGAVRCALCRVLCRALLQGTTGYYRCSSVRRQRSAPADPSQTKRNRGFRPAACLSCISFQHHPRPPNDANRITAQCS